MKVVALTLCLTVLLACHTPSDADDDPGDRAPLGGACDDDNGKDACVPGAVCDDARCVPLPACGEQCSTDEVTGIQSCDRGSYENRVAPPEACFPEVRLDDSAGCGDGEPCPSGFDCVPDGFSQGDAGDPNRMGCVKACTVDADCDPDMACLCGNTRANVGVSLRVNECVPASCRSTDDCGGYPCGVARSACNQEVSLQCRTADDSCFLVEVSGQCSLCSYTGDRFEGREYSNCD